MEKFIVSARKYRPQTFDTVIGQSHITTTLKNAIRHQQLAHAFLFCGPRGVGKTTCARILAKTINCENQTKEGEACNTCASCISFNEGGSLNYFEMDGASNNKVEDMHDLIASVRVRPGSGQYKVYVIDEVHMLSSSAFNAFLKTLEEPPPYAIFILATTEKQKILPTILSRCQIFDFKRITLQDTVSHLKEIAEKENIKADKAALQVIAQKSEGCMRDALSILDKIVSFTNGELTYNNTLEHLNILDADCYFKFLGHMQEQDLSGALLLYDEINRKGFEGDLVLNGFSEFLRNLLVCRDEKAAVLLEVVDSFKENYTRVAQTVSSAFLVSALNIINQAEIIYRDARNKRLHVELTLIRLCYLQQAIRISAGNGGLDKKKIVEQGNALAFRNIVPFTRYSPANKEKKTEQLDDENRKTGARLIIETREMAAPASIEMREIQGTSVEQAAATQTVPKVSALDKIRKQYQTNGDNGNGHSKLKLEIDSLQKAWAEFVVQLKEARSPAAQPFELALLRIRDENCFEAVTANTIEKQFIEQQRNKLFSFLKDKLQIRRLQFNVIVEEKASDRPVLEVSLSTREQFIKMSEQYPLVKELKERLKLELDY